VPGWRIGPAIAEREKFSGKLVAIREKGGLGVTQHLADGPDSVVLYPLKLTPHRQYCLPMRKPRLLLRTSFSLEWIAVRMILMADRGEKMPSQMPSSTMGFPMAIDLKAMTPAGSYVHRQHIYAARMVPVDARNLSDIP
jgi:hypothetical protein